MNGKHRVKHDCYRDWESTDENVRAVAEDSTAFPVMRALAREVLALREQIASAKKQKASNGDRSAGH